MKAPLHLIIAKQGPYLILAGSQDSEAMQSQMVRMAGSVNKEDGVVESTSNLVFRMLPAMSHFAVIRSRTRNFCILPS
jgi:hypothetical protein